VDIIDAAARNLTTPPVIAFLVGVIAVLAKSPVRLPDQVATFITYYLLLAIGVKGGYALSSTRLADFALPVVITLGVGLVTPLFAYAMFRRLGRFSVVDAAALCAHYGSVSMVTYVESQNFLDVIPVTYEGFMSALLVVLEVPAIILALVIANRGRVDGQRSDIRHTLGHVLPEPSIVLLLGGLAIGWIGGQSGWEATKGFFDAPFRGILTVFLLQMGIVAAGHLKHLRRKDLVLIAFGIGIPLVNGMIGALAGRAAGLSLGGATVLACMAASASYIAAPAAMQMALPQANPGYYLPAAIGVTFPFNVVFGIPLYYGFTQLLY
jgi:uncharacterized protein